MSSIRLVLLLVIWKIGDITLAEDVSGTHLCANLSFKNSSLSKPSCLQWNCLESDVNLIESCMFRIQVGFELTKNSLDLLSHESFYNIYSAETDLQLSNMIKPHSVEFVANRLTSLISFYNFQNLEPPRYLLVSIISNNLCIYSGVAIATNT
jgi:hypothetical protein